MCNIVILKFDTIINIFVVDIAILILISIKNIFLIINKKFLKNHKTRLTHKNDKQLKKIKYQKI